MKGNKKHRTQTTHTAMHHLQNFTMYQCTWYVICQWFKQALTWQVLRFVNRNMFMQFLGHGIGHKVTDHVQQSPICIPYEEPKLLDRDIIPYNTQTHAPTELECYDPGPRFSFSGPLISFPRHSLPFNPLSVTCHQVTLSQGVPRILLDCHITLQAHWLFILYCPTSSTADLRLFLAILSFRKVPSTHCPPQ